MRAGTPTVACIAFGHDLCYPAANRTLKGLIEKQGLVLGEYPPGTEPLRPYFLQRNRLIAALSRGVCVAEARRVSGTMNTVHAALGYGKDVFAVPGQHFLAAERGRQPPSGPRRPGRGERGGYSGILWRCAARRRGPWA